MLRAIIFDFDGVIIDSYKYSKSIAKEVGHDVSDENFKAHHDGNVYESPKIPFTIESAEKFFRKYIENIHLTKPHLEPINLNKLSKKYNLFILSSNSKKPIDSFLKHHKINGFKEIYGSETHKSKVEKFKMVLKKYNFKKEECIFITDTLGDILEANEIGIKTIAVDFGFHERERLEKGKPYKIVSSFDEIIDEIKKIN